MGASRISSDVMTAQSAISKLTGIEAGAIQNESVHFAGSNITCMKAGQDLTNHLLKDVGELVSTIQKQADKIEGLAQTIEYRDSMDATSWGF
ncbi:hypothetical protein [Lactococcus protaetiae]|uniref:Type VII secretion effector n=1 Tax=Lactococcus protaetiae TaxID=2592653 RepID=A0A514Z818_9LACT|nr:hypothetical protein [Lactococcus protaetiae]QDK70728.1 hypothetical protein FLP15_05635 [Lactococcus protaetiae]